MTAAEGGEGLSAATPVSRETHRSMRATSLARKLEQPASQVTTSSFWITSSNLTALKHTNQLRLDKRFSSEKAKGKSQILTIYY
jgi:hypothetical protein